MEQVLGGYGAFTLGLLTLCGGIIGLQAGMWAVALLSVICTVGIVILWLWENWQGLIITQRETSGMTTLISSGLSPEKGTRKHGTGNL